MISTTVFLALLGAVYTAKVVHVSDGDTLTVLHDNRPIKIRLHGIDAPEKAQPFGQRAKQFVIQHVAGKTIRIEVVTRDRYGRTVAKVFYGAKGQHSLQEALVQAGLAWWYRQYDRKNQRLLRLESAARKARRGLWSDARPIAPWAWRRQRRKY